MPKSDPAHRETDKLLAKMEAEIKSVYTQAYKEAQQTADSFMKQFTDADAKKREALENGDISKEEYARWQRTQLFQGKRYQQMADTLSKDLTNSNKIAASVINGHLPEVYALNHNYGTYEMESGGRVNTQYTLYDRQTVERLLRDDPDLLPHARVDIPKDLIWNKKSINSAITQGILQGEDIDTISQRLAHTVTDMSRTSAIRNARTMTTSAENGGRIDSYKRAESMGIKMVQVWVATLDDRTRHEHRQLDGQKRKVGEPFTVEGYEIDFPADPKAEAFLVYNCRCTLIGQVQGVNFDLSDTTSRDSKLGDMSYEQWKEGKKKEEPAPEKKESIRLGTDFFPDEFKKTIETAFEGMERRAAIVYRDAIEAAEKKVSEDGTAYNKDDNTINFNVEEFELMESDTVIHETTHYLDYNTPMTYENRYTKKEWARDEEGELLLKDGKPYRVEVEEVFQYDTKSVTSWISFGYESEDRVSDWEKAASILGVTMDNATPFGGIVTPEELTSRSDNLHKWLREKGVSEADRPHITDVLSSFVEEQYPFSLSMGGHNLDYWNKDVQRQYSECLAAYSVLRSRNSDAVHCIEEICPNLYKLLEKGYEEMMKRVR